MRSPIRKVLMSAITILLVASAIHPARAQSDTDQHYFSPDLGLTFSFPTGWEVEEIKKALIMGDPTDLQLLADGQPPDGLVIKVVEAARADFGLTNVQSLPELLATVGQVGPAKSITVGDFPGLEADLPNNSGGAIAVRISEARWALITTKTSDWQGDTPLFEDILATFSFSPPGVRASKSVAIKYGAKIHQNFQAGDNSLTFTFAARISEIVTITVEADKDDPLDPALQLVGPDETVVAQNDDSLDSQFGLLNSRLVGFPIPKSGTYTIRVLRNGTAGSGFTLTLTNK